MDVQETPTAIDRPLPAAAADGEAMDVSDIVATEATAKKSAQQCFDSDTDAAQLAEYDLLLLNRPAFILDKFLVRMPDTFYRFWQFCSDVRPDDPSGALVPLGLLLVGPFDVLAGRFDGLAPREPAAYLRHCRYFYDPPEFQTVLAGTGGKRDGLHYGYWRDDPQAPDANAPAAVLVAQTDADRGCAVRLIGTNLFAAVLHHLDKEVRLSPFELAGVTSLRKKLRQFCESNSIAVDDQSLSSVLRERNAKVVVPTLHAAGLVVPLDRRTRVGYRPLSAEPAQLREWLRRLDDPEDGDTDAVFALVMERVQPVLTAALIAVDESDFGTAIELGVELFGHGSVRLHSVAMQMLATGYAMVRRPQLIAIVKAHLAQRRRGTDVSIL